MTHNNNVIPPEVTWTEVPCPPPIPSWNCIPGYYNTTYTPGTDEIPAVPAIPAIPDTYATNNCTGFSLVENTNASGMFGSMLEHTNFIADANNGYQNANMDQLLWCVDTSVGVFTTAGAECFCNNGLGYLARGPLWSVTYTVTVGTNQIPGVSPGARNLVDNVGTYSDVVTTLNSYVNVNGDSANITMGMTDIEMKNALQVIVGNDLNHGPAGNINISHVYPICNCSGYVPGTDEIPGTDAIPAIPPAQVNTWVPGYCEEITTWPSDGEFSSLASCENTCLIPLTWNCLTSYPSGWPNTGGTPVAFCDEVYDGTGVYTSLVNCEETCIVVGPVDDDWVFDDPDDPDNPDPIPSWDCDSTWSCSDPGTGLGEFLSLALCEENCMPPVWIGDCDINTATVYDNSLSYVTGDIVEYLGFYYYAPFNIAALSPNPGIAQLSWVACAPNITGPCNYNATTVYDPSNAYAEGSIVTIVNFQGNTVTFYAAYDIPAGGIAQLVPNFEGMWHPVGYIDSVTQVGFWIYDTYDPISNTTNPWIACDEYVNLDIGDCYLGDDANGNATQWDPNITYGGPNYIAQMYDPTGSGWGQINVWYQNNFYTLNCEFTSSQIDNSNCCYLADGTVLDPNGGSVDYDMINQGMQDCYTDGVTIPPGNLQDQYGDDLPGTGYWELCQSYTIAIDNYYACCDLNSVNYNSNCFNDVTCTCDYSFTC